MFTVQNFTSDPYGWKICGCCAADLPTDEGRAVGAWVQVGATIVSIVCPACETKLTRAQPKPTPRKK